ncbi:MAG: hypothetical protein KC414_05005 [Romboutsia sp.]|nr:hypothetical protein [Romboutsia sp.]
MNEEIKTQTLKESKFSTFGARVFVDLKEGPNGEFVKITKSKKRGDKKIKDIITLPLEDIDKLILSLNEIKN